VPNSRQNKYQSSSCSGTRDHCIGIVLRLAWFYYYFCTSSWMNSLDSLSNDLICHLVTNFLFEISSREDFNQIPLPSEIFTLQLVSKRFYNLINSKNKNNLIWEAILNFRNCCGCSQLPVENLVKQSARLYGSITLIQWLAKYLKFPLNESAVIGATQGTVLPKIIYMQMLFLIISSQTQVVT
jgi:hypothetical protein